MDSNSHQYNISFYLRSIPYVQSASFIVMIYIIKPISVTLPLVAIRNKKPMLYLKVENPDFTNKHKKVKNILQTQFIYFIRIIFTFLSFRRN